MKLKNLILILLIVIFLVVGLNISAQDQPRNLDVKYPDIPDSQAPETVTMPVPQYVKYIYNFAILASGILALLVLIYAGFQYLTSAGNAEKMGAAKNRITAALVGLLILGGSYLILRSINPGLVEIKLERLRPIISELSAGVWLCKRQLSQGDIDRAWGLTYEYNTTIPTVERVKQIEKELNPLLDTISLNCYLVAGEQDIPPGYDNQVQYTFFVPNITITTREETNPVTGRTITQREIDKIVEYGAVIYEKSNFEGTTQLLARNLTDPQGSADAYGEPVTIESSSIKPFALIYQPEKNWKVILYEWYNQNQGVDLKSEPFQIKGQEGMVWFSEYDLDWKPKSLEIVGDLLAVLCKQEVKVEKCHVFYNKSVNNLENYDNIVKWVSCKDYEGKRTRNKVISVMAGAYIKECAEAAATRLLILSAKLY